MLMSVAYIHDVSAGTASGGGGGTTPQMSDYCLTPPYIGAAIEPNLLLLIDNSASMYDLAYTDNTVYYYCANNPGTSCTTAGTTCSGTAYCLSSQITNTFTTTSPKSCTSAADCPLNGDLCKNSQCTKSNVTVTTSVTNPVSCSSDATCSSITAGDTCNNKCISTTHSCVDSTYNNTASYDGLFVQTASYCYSSKSSNPFVTCSNSPGWDEFDSPYPMPSTCSIGGAGSLTPFVCINVNASNQITQFVASGRFLNWLSLSKFDLEKKILTGGKYDTFTADLVGETRGCSGRKFIKTVPGLPNITFAVRGGSTSGIDKITSQSTEYGQSYIEVYGGQYNAAACIAAVNDWMNVTTTNQGPLQGDTNCCLTPGTKTSGCNASATLDAANQSIHDCFWYYNGHGLSNMQPIENTCINDWATTPANTITLPDAPDAICSSVLSHMNSLVWPFGSPGYNTGYLGMCFINGAWDNTCALNENKDYCQSLGNASAVPDPAPATVAPTAVSNVPGFMTEMGLAAMPMMNDYTSSGGTKGFKVQIWDPSNHINTVTGMSEWPPTGLINKYKDIIRFGAMAFSNNGSGSECNKYGYCSSSASTSCSADSSCGANADGSPGRCVYAIPCANVCSTTVTRQCNQSSDCPAGETCGPLVGTDGGVIIGSIGPGYCSITAATACTFDSDCPATETCKANVGNHYGGLIAQIDTIPATSWTPFAEAYYNAMGYFARTTDYPVLPATDTSATALSRTDFIFSGLGGGYATNINPSQKACQKNNVMIITDGMSTADWNTQSENFASTYAPLVTSVVNGTSYNNISGYDSSNRCPSYSGSRSLPVLTWVSNHRNIKNLSQTDPKLKHCSNDIFGSSCTDDSQCGGGNICTNLPTRSSESINTYVVYSGAATSNLPGLCDPLTFMTAAAWNGGTKLFQSTDLSQLQTTLASAFDQVAARAASGTAASVLASQGKSGANIIQTVFYPHKTFHNSVTNLDDEISWLGHMTNLWYWVDPFANTSSIREDDGTTGSSNATPWMGDKKLHLKTDDATYKDYIIQMYYDKNASATKANRWADPQGNGVIGAPKPTINFEDLGYLWEAGTILWKTDPANRTIYTTADGANLTPFTIANIGTYQSFLNTAATTTIVNWVRGYDFIGYRPRTVMMTNIDATARVWKLGDIINSTPTLMSAAPQNSYATRYGDGTYSSFVSSSSYLGRGMVFAGGNDGMLHAFKLGTMQFSWSGQANYDVARLVGDTGGKCTTGLPGDGTSATCGQEKWAFIPKSVLPYLQYLADPGYCHIYTVDLTPVLVDASIGASADTADTIRTSSSWRTILIGGMRFGGACKSSQLPMTGVGYSSYFALDVTNPNSPVLLWEFNNPNLGFATTGPGILRIDGQIGGKPNASTNGHWYVVFGSGPTGPISTGDHQFLGSSDQNLRLFILDMKTGQLLSTIDTGVTNAFAGSMVSSALDLDNDYQDEVAYVPYTQENTFDGTWTNGGVLRLLTNRNADPTKWTVSTLISDIGPVTTGVSKIFDATSGNLWVYIGTGRYYYVQNAASDDPVGQRYFMGIKDPCEGQITSGTACTSSVSFCSNGCSDPTSTPACTSPTTCGDLVNVTDVSKAPSPSSGADAPSFKGWYIALDPSGLYTYPPDSQTNFLSERVVNDSLATSGGVLYFTTYKPYTDLCLLGGKSFVWAVQYNNGGNVANLKGMVLVQSSTGAIQETNLGNALTDSGGRKSNQPIEGLTGGTPVVQSQPQPVNRVVHIKER
jgi:type IV pilus assembly protein PilY1